MSTEWSIVNKFKCLSVIMRVEVQFERLMGYIAIKEKLNPIMHFYLVAKQGLMKIK